MEEKNLKKIAGEMLKNWIEEQKNMPGGLSSQGKIQKALGIPQPRISYYINGKTYPDHKKREILYKATGLICFNPDWFEKNGVVSENLEPSLSVEEAEEINTEEAKLEVVISEPDKQEIIKKEEEIIKSEKRDSGDFSVIFAGYLQNIIEENIKKAFNGALENLIKKAETIEIYKIKEKEVESENNDAIFEFLEHLDTQINDIQNKTSRIYSDLVGLPYEESIQKETKIIEEKKENRAESDFKLEMPEMPEVEISDFEISGAKDKIIELSKLLTFYSNFPEGGEKREAIRLALIEPVKRLFMAIFVFDKQYPSSLSDVIQQYRQIIFLNSKNIKNKKKEEK